MQSGIELKQLFQSEDLLEFWNRVPDGKYPNLKTNAPKNASVLGSTYVCEALFSKMIRIKNQYRNRLTDDHLKQLLRRLLVLHSLQLHLVLTNLLKLKANTKLDIKLICVFFLVGVAIRWYVLSCYIIFVIITPVFLCGSTRTLKFGSDTKKGWDALL